MALNFYPSRCECKEGYEGDGIECGDVNECVVGNDCDSRTERSFCNNTDGSYTCGCYSGYNKASDNTCEDINECLNPGMLKTPLNIYFHCSLYIR